MSKTGWAAAETQQLIADEEGGISYRKGLLKEESGLAIVWVKN